MSSLLIAPSTSSALLLALKRWNSGSSRSNFLPAAISQSTSSSSSARLVGSALTQMTPSGRVELVGKRYEARCAVGMIERGAKIRVARYEDFDVVVEEVTE